MLYGGRASICTFGVWMTSLFEMRKCESQPARFRRMKVYRQWKGRESLVEDRRLDIYL